MKSDFITVEDAKDINLIPEDFHKYFKETCSYCGKPMIINYAATVMKCGNPKCYRKVGLQASDMLHDLGYKGYGPESLTAYCTRFDIKSITEFINHAPYPLNLDIDLNNLRLTYPKLIEMLHIPHLGTKVHKLFAGCNNIQDFINMMDSAADLQTFMTSRAGGPVLGLEAAEILGDYEEDLTEITNIVKVVPQAKTITLIAITGHLNFNGGCTKDEFVYLLNKLAEPLGVEFRRSDALKSVKFIVADTPSSSRKYRIGIERNNIVSSTALYLAVQKLVQEKEENSNVRNQSDG